MISRFSRAGLSPDSLASRTILLMVAVVAVAEITTFSLIFQYHRTLHEDITTRHIADQVRLLQSILPGLDEKSRRRLEDTGPGEQWLPLRPDDELVPAGEPEFGFARVLARKLEWTLGEPVRLRYSGRYGSLWIGFHSGGERWWLILPAPRFNPHDLPRGLGWNSAPRWPC
jgi:hypothetical protein